MKTQKQLLGNLGEDLAVEFLEKQGYKIIERNLKTGRVGEIDIIARKDGELIFIEVKTKSNHETGLPEEEFNFHKKKKMQRAIQSYLWKNNFQNEPIRVDLIAIDVLKQFLPDQKPEVKIRHYPDMPIFE
ncbi:MAG: YraN family protein [Patescibacteria group bacterium]|nr:YraN family protein [Patescibacteria group bacterium]MDD5534711.1 YraN family protein [Patescibacteria group bacterium]